MVKEKGKLGSVLGTEGILNLFTLLYFLVDSPRTLLSSVNIVSTLFK